MPQENSKNYRNNHGKKILLVEHNERIRNKISNYLNHFNEVDIAVNGIIGLEKFKQEFYDLVIIDKNLPYKDAEVLAESIQKNFSNVPILFISEQEEKNMKNHILIKNFEKEYEKYLLDTQPVKTNETTTRKNIYQIGNYKFDAKKRYLWYRNETPVKLSPKLNKLLRILIENKDHLVTKELLIKKVWYNDEAQNLKSMGVYITKLRKILEKDSRIKINNVYKTGFILTIN